MRLLRPGTRGGDDAVKRWAAAFTAATGALSVVFSESSTTVTAFYEGSVILELNTQ